MNEKYKIIHQIGEGGFAKTFLVEDVANDRKVVLKQLSLSRSDDWKTIELFEREAEILANLDHPAIPSYIDYFEHDGDALTLCLVQELAGGSSLHEKVANGWRADPQDLLIQLLKILVYLQSRNPVVIHRDIKPENVVVDDDGVIALVDFGAVSQVVTESIGGSTFIGTVGYMPPEQQIGQVRLNTDLFGAALTVVNGATGLGPEKLTRSRLKIKIDELGFDPAIERTLGAMLEPAHEDRLPSAEHALELLNSIETGISYPAPEVHDVELPTSKNLEVGKWLELAVIGGIAVTTLFATTNPGALALNMSMFCFFAACWLGVSEWSRRETRAKLNERNTGRKFESSGVAVIRRTRDETDFGEPNYRFLNDVGEIGMFATIAIIAFAAVLHVFGLSITGLGTSPTFILLLLGLAVALTAIFRQARRGRWIRISKSHVTLFVENLPSKTIDLSEVSFRSRSIKYQPTRYYLTDGSTSIKLPSLFGSQEKLAIEFRNELDRRKTERRNATLDSPNIEEASEGGSEASAEDTVEFPFEEEFDFQKPVQVEEEQTS